MPAFAAAVAIVGSDKQRRQRRFLALRTPTPRVRSVILRLSRAAIRASLGPVGLDGLQR